MTNQINRKSFILYKDSLDILDKLSDEQAGKLFKAIHFYQKKQEIPALDFALDLVFTSFLNQFKRDDESYKTTCEARKLAGSKGGKQKVANASNCKKKVANLADSENDSENESKNDNVNHNHNSKTQAISKTEASELDLFCDEVVISLKEILSKKLNRNIATNNWSKEIKLIVNNDLKIRGEQQAKQDLTRCIKAIESNYGKDYFPIIQSAKSLREKFIKIEDYLARSNKKSNEAVNFIDEANNIAGMKVFLRMEVLSNKVEIFSNGKALDIPAEKRALIKKMFEEMFGKKEMVLR